MQHHYRPAWSGSRGIAPTPLTGDRPQIEHRPHVARYLPICARQNTPERAFCAPYGGDRLSTISPLRSL
jgi:hypothetical protein